MGPLTLAFAVFCLLSPPRIQAYLFPPGGTGVGAGVGVKHLKPTEKKPILAFTRKPEFVSFEFLGFFGIAVTKNLESALSGEGKFPPV